MQIELGFAKSYARCPYKHFCRAAFFVWMMFLPSEKNFFFQFCPYLVSFLSHKIKIKNKKYWNFFTIYDIIYYKQLFYKLT